MINFSSSLSETVAAYRQTGGARPSAETLVNALLAAEKAAKQEKLTYPWSSLLGKWELCFATGTKKAQKRGGIVLGKGFYVPKFVNIQISFSASSPEDANKGEIANQVQFGPMLLQLTGPAHYLGKKNLLAFDFNYLVLSLFGRIVYQGSIRAGKVQAEDFYQQPIAKLPFFAFFLVKEDFIAARGRGGGLALWIRSH